MRTGAAAWLVQLLLLLHAMTRAEDDEFCALASILAGGQSPASVVTVHELKESCMGAAAGAAVVTIGPEPPDGAATPWPPPPIAVHMACSCTHDPAAPAAPAEPEPPDAEPAAPSTVAVASGIDTVLPEGQLQMLSSAAYVKDADGGWVWGNHPGLTPELQQALECSLAACLSCRGIVGRWGTSG